MSISNFGSFLSNEELDSYNPDFSTVQLVLTETYNEYDLKKTIDKIGSKILCAIAIQLAIIGYGQKKYNSVHVDGKLIDIEEFFIVNGVKSDLNVGAKLTTTDLTPRRLIRFFRRSILKYLLDNSSLQSYLFKKYCYNKTDDNRISIFPGFEHLAIVNKDEIRVLELLTTYKNLDSKLGTKVFDRITRVLIARGFDINALQKIENNKN